MGGSGGLGARGPQGVSVQQNLGGSGNMAGAQEEEYPAELGGLGGMDECPAELGGLGGLGGSQWDSGGPQGSHQHALHHTETAQGGARKEGEQDETPDTAEVKVRGD